MTNKRNTLSMEQHNVKIINVILLNYNSSGDIYNFFDCLEITEELTLRFIVVDNYYSPNEAEKISLIGETFNNLDILTICSPTNTGYAGGINMAYKKIIELDYEGDILILNPDVRILNTSILELTKAKADNILAISPRTMDSNMNILYDSIKLRGFFHQFKITQNNDIIETDYCVGACLFLNREVLKKLNLRELFYEDFFMYWEEVDLCLYGKKHGYKCVCNPNSVIIRRGNSPRRSSNTFFYMIRNSLIIKKRHPEYFNSLNLIAYLFFMLIKALYLSIKFGRSAFLINYTNAITSKK